MIRFKVFIPFLVLLGLVSFVLVYRIDSLVKNWLESGISAITDTKTDISDLSISFKNSRLAIRRLEIASSQDEWKNAVEFENIIIDFQSLPLLKKRFVVDNFSLKGIQWGTKRSHSGKLPVRAKPKNASWVSKTMNSAFASLKSEFSKTPVGKLTDFSLPNDTRDILNGLHLQSEEAYKSASLLGQQLRGAWTERLKDIRDVSAYESKIQEARALLKNPPQDPKAILDAIETVRRFQKFFEDEKTRIESVVKTAGDDVKRIESEVDKARKALDADVQKAKGLVSLDGINIENISKILIGDLWIQRAEKVLLYQAMLRKALASTSKDKDIEVKHRAKGRDIVFVTPVQEPSFVFAKSDFSVKTVDGGDQKLVNQVYDLKLRDITSDPKLYGKPTTIAAKADFKNGVLETVGFDALLDYTKDLDHEKFGLSARGIVSDGLEVGVPKLFPVKLKKGLADTNAQLEFTGDDFSWQTKFDLRQVEWDFSEVPNRGTLIPLLQGIFERVDSFSVNVKFDYKNEKFGFDVSSDMDAKIKTGVEAVLQKKILEFESRLKAEIEAKIQAYKGEAESEVGRFKSEVENKILSNAQTALNSRNEMLSVQNGLEKQSQKAIQKAAGQTVQDGLQQIQKNLPSLPNPFR